MTPHRLVNIARRLVFAAEPLPEVDYGGEIAAATLIISCREQMLAIER